MKKSTALALFVTLSSTAAFAQSKSHDTEVHQLLKKMTLEEKVGQMTQVTIDVVSAGKDGKETPHTLDAAKLEDVIGKHHVGSILNVVDDAYSIDHWHDLLAQIQDVATKKTRLHVPILYGIDAIHGANFTTGATLFPQAIAMAATFNREAAEKEGEIVAREVKATGIPWNFYPDLDVTRQPLWSRIWETYGEDTYLVTEMGSSYIRGHHDVATCMKHYLGYGAPWSGKDRTPAYLTERMIRETFLPPFAAAVKLGVPTVMINSSQIDGVPGHANRRFLTDVLRKELGFKGIAVSDWEDIKRLHTRDRLAETPKEAVRIAVMAGVDMSMVPYDLSFYDYLVELVKEGKVPMSRIDEAVGRILRVKYQLGLFENPYPNADLKKNLATADATQTNLETAQEALTLLKNVDGTLPLSKKANVLVTGPNADLLSVLNGGWTITWQGNRESLYPKNKKTVVQAIRDKIGADHVTYVDSTKDADEAVQAAKHVDTVILVLGEKTYTETPGNIDDLTLDAAQLELADRIEKTGTPVILVLIEGRPRVIRPIVEGAKAVLMAYLPGMEGARAISDVLFGDANPSGKLPMTYPRFPNALTPYDHVAMEELEGNTFNPQFQFGQGLSYTTFKYSDLKLDHDRIGKNGKLKISVNVTNTGNLAGKESALLFLTDLYASIARPVKQLRGFEKVRLAPGETQTVQFTLTPAELSFVNQQNQRVVEPGDFQVEVGGLTKSFTVSKQ